jgi:hypothetical protein
MNRPNNIDGKMLREDILILPPFKNNCPSLLGTLYYTSF